MHRLARPLLIALLPLTLLATPEPVHSAPLNLLVNGDFEQVDGRRGLRLSCGYPVGEGCGIIECRRGARCATF